MFTELNLATIADISFPLPTGNPSGGNMRARQSANASGTNIASLAKIFTESCSKGNLLIAVVQWQMSSGSNSITPNTPTDTASSTWTQIGTTQLSTTTYGAQVGLAVFMATAASTPTTETITCTLSGTATGAVRLIIYEMECGSTAATVDVSATNSGAGTALTGSITTTVDYDLMLVAISSNTAPSLNTIGYWILEQGAWPTVFDKPAGSAGSYSFSNTAGANTDWCLSMIGFKTNSNSMQGGAGLAGRLFYKTANIESSGTIATSPVWPTFTMPNGYVGNAYSYNWNLYPASSPTTYTLSSGSLPPGLSLSNLGGDQGQISGTPTLAGTYTFTILASNGYGSASQSFTIVITNPTGVARAFAYVG